MAAQVAYAFRNARHSEYAHRRACQRAKNLLPVARGLHLGFSRQARAEPNPRHLYTDKADGRCQMPRLVRRRGRKKRVQKTRGSASSRSRHSAAAKPGARSRRFTGKRLIRLCERRHNARRHLTAHPGQLCKGRARPAVLLQVPARPRTVLYRAGAACPDGQHHELPARAIRCAAAKSSDAQRVRFVAPSSRLRLLHLHRLRFIFMRLFRKSCVCLLTKPRFVHYNNRANGVWRSLVSRLVRDQEASGSNPDTPTKSG